MEYNEKQEFEKEVERVVKWNNENPSNDPDSIINEYLQIRGKNFDNNKGDRIQTYLEDREEESQKQKKFIWGNHND